MMALKQMTLLRKALTSYANFNASIMLTRSATFFGFKKNQQLTLVDRSNRVIYTAEIMAHKNYSFF